VSVQRYKVQESNCYFCFDAQIVSSDSGEYVRYSDYAAFKNHIEALEMIIKAYRDCKDVIEANNKIASLEGENAALRAKVEWLTAKGVQS
jgi:hypothetical protein